MIFSSEISDPLTKKLQIRMSQIQGKLQASRENIHYSFRGIFKLVNFFLWGGGGSVGLSRSGSITLILCVLTPMFRIRIHLIRIQIQHFLGQIPIRIRIQSGYRVFIIKNWKKCWDQKLQLTYPWAFGSADLIDSGCSTDPFRNTAWHGSA